MTRGRRYQDCADAGLRDRLPAIECFRNRFRGYRITISVPEYTAVCPKTGLPDFGTITIEYEPAEKVIELKSLKMYLLAYRNLGIFYENAVNRILDDVVNACEPRYAIVRGVFSSRGGISSAVEACYPRKACVSGEVSARRMTASI